MKRFILSFALLSLLISSCEGQEEIKFDLSLYPGGSNFVKNGVEVDNGFIVIGQKFTYTDSITNRSAIVKIDAEGKVQKEIFLGREKYPSSKLESIFSTSDNRLFLLGEDYNKLWVREIDQELEVIRDTIFNANVDCLFDPILFPFKDQFVIIANTTRSSDLFSVVFTDKNLENPEYVHINSKNSFLKYLYYSIRDICYDEKSGKAYILGAGCLEKDHEGLCKKNEYSILVYDPVSKRVQDKIIINDGIGFESIVVYDDQILVAGIVVSEQENIKNADNFIQILNIEGNKKNVFKIDDHNCNRLKSVTIIENEIIIVGHVFDEAVKKFYPAFVRTNLEGEVLESHIETIQFNNEDGWGMPHWEKAISTNNGEILLVGQGDGWRVQLRGL